MIDHRSTITAPVEGMTGPADSTVPHATATARAGVRSRLLATTLEHRFIALLLLLFVAKGVVITFVHPPFTGHDEVAHYAYLQLAAEESRIPRLPDLENWRDNRQREGNDHHDHLPEEFWSYCRFTTRDWSPGCGDPNYRTPVYAMVLGGDYYPTGWIYTANHPPLYYLVMTPVYNLTADLSIESQLYWLRLAAIPFGLATVLFAWLTARTLFPRDRFLALTVPTFVAFQPQIAYEAAMLNNDILAIAFTSAVVYLLALGLKQGFPLRIVLLIGFCYGLAVLSKNTSLTTGAIIAFAMVLGIGIRRWRSWLGKGLLAALVTALLIWPWYLYMHRTYGDFTALGRISDLQYWNDDSGRMPTVWDQAIDLRFAWMRWRETWGEFGWRRIPLGSPGNWPLLRTLLWIAMAATIGIAVWAVRLWRTGHRIATAGNDADAERIAAASDNVLVLARWQVVGVLTMGVTCALAYLAVLQFGTTFSLTQARYYFPAIVPAALLFMLGLRSLIPRRWLGVGQVAVFASLVLLTLVIYTAYVLPYWSSADIANSDLNPFYR